MSVLNPWICRVYRCPWFPSMPRCFLAVVLLFLSGCSESDSRTEDQIGLQPANVESAQDKFAAALGAGKGGGSLMFDGTSYTIDSVTCVLGPRMEVGTVGEGYRVLIDGAERPRATILSPDSVHWTHIDWKTVNFTVSGSVITSSATSYRNNSDDRVIAASFEINCP